MSYTPTLWTTGDVITATKLNKIEEGIASAGGGGGLVVEVTRTTEPRGLIANKTWLEIHNALSSMPVSVVFNLDTVGDYNSMQQDVINSIYYDDEDYNYYITIAEYDFVASSPDSYPQFTYPSP